MAKSKFPSVSYELAYEISNRLGSEVRVVVPGHTQREERQMLLIEY